MHASFTFAAALVALAPAVQAQGTAFINNLCNFDVYVFPVSTGDFQGPIKIAANGGSYSQKYKSFSSGGMSMKLSKTKECVDITQFEYTLTGSQVFYDISNVDCYGTDSCPFSQNGLHMTSGSGCPVVTCQPGDKKCHDAYNLWNDDWATKACTTDADTTLHLCSTNGVADAIESMGSSVLSAVSSLIPAAPSQAAPAKAAAPKSSESVEVAAAPTSSATPSTSETPSSTPTTMATSVKPKPSVAAPETTEAPKPNIVYTTEIAYTTQWATKWVEGRSVHEDFHHRAKPRSPHAHARRRQHE